MSPQIAVRLSAEEWAAVDAVVASGRCPSRAAAIREGLALLLKQERDREIAEAYQRAAELPPDIELDRWVASAADRLGARLQEEDPWPQDGPGTLTPPRDEP